MNALLLLAQLSGQPAPESLVTGSGYVSGTLQISCPEPGFGPARASLHLSGDAQLRDSRGGRGRVPLSGSAFLNGRCELGGDVAISGLVPVSGRGRLNGPEGSRSVDAHGSAAVSVRTRARSAHLRLHVDVRAR